MRIIRCKTNHLTEPFGFDLGQPVFTWDVADARGSCQAEARILVYDGEAVCLDTGFRADISSLGFRAEIALQPRRRYSWTVTVRTDAGEEETSGLNTFETGKMEEPWTAEWISCPLGGRLPVFRKRISVRKGLTRARLYLCGLGMYEAAVNGRCVGNELFTPYCNNYNAWQQVIAHDITALLAEESELAIMLAPGWYAGRFGFTSKAGQPGYYGNDLRLIAEVHLEYADGSSECIPTDGSWQLTRSRCTFSGIYDGEHWDETLPETEPEPVTVLQAGTELLRDRLSPPVYVQMTLAPVQLIHTPKGETVLDLGQNHTGIFRLNVHEPKGTEIRLQFGEVLQQGCFYNENLRTAKAEFRYVSSGQPAVLEPKFTFYGYRYVKIDGVRDLDPGDYSGLVVHSDLEEIGGIRTGDERVNRLIDNAHWSLRSNFLDVPTDCPQRDERMGWTGDANVFAPTACRFRDTYAFYRKYLRDLWTEQQSLDGMVPEVIPSFGDDHVSSVWGDAATVIPWTLYQASGDLSILREQLESMEAWVDWILKTDGGIHAWRSHFHYGDWLALDHPSLRTDTVFGGTEEGFIADTAWAESAGIAADSAALLGREAESGFYRSLQKKIRDGLKEEYFTATGRCAIETQTALLLTLKYGLSDHPDKILQQLDKRFRQSEGKLQTGFVGSPILCNVLSENGRHTQAVDLLLNEDYPGWLYEVAHGATTIWERWNSLSADGSVSSTGMNSFNHYAYGSIVEWMFRHLAGLLPAAPGCRKARIAPLPDARLGHVEMHYLGWRIGWEAEDDRHLQLRVTVPFGCEAEVVLPFAGKVAAEDQRRFGQPLGPGTYEVRYETDRSMRPVA